jgi:hypothetical protein
MGSEGGKASSAGSDALGLPEPHGHSLLDLALDGTLLQFDWVGQVKFDLPNRRLAALRSISNAIFFELSLCEKRVRQLAKPAHVGNHNLVEVDHGGATLRPCFKGLKINHPLQ